MTLGKILEYQNIDKELIAIEREDAKSAERAAYLNARNKVGAATEAAIKLFAESDDILSGYSKLTEKIAELEKKLNEFNGIVDDIAYLDETDYYLKQIDAILSELSTLEREASSTSQRIDAVNSSIQKTWEAGSALSEAGKQAEAAYKQYLAGYVPRINEIKAQLNELQKDIPPKIMSAYMNLRNQKKWPIFVEYVPDPKGSAPCKACGIAPSNDVRSKLKASGDVAECPNCHRILYVS